MDTTTVNYAIEKLNEAFLAIKPTAVELGSEFVGYMVLKATILPFIWLIILIVAIFGLVKGIKMATSSENDTAGDIAGIFMSVGGAAGMIVSLGSLFVDTYLAILANAYPLMYTIEQLAKQ